MNEKEYIESLYPSQKVKYEAKSEISDYIPVIDDDVARTITQLIMIKKPKKILELGTSIGFSTTMMAKTASEYGGHITTIEYDKEVANEAKKLFNSEKLNNVELIIDDARKALFEIDCKFDMIFMDLDKSLYSVLFKQCINLLSKDGLLLAEDTLFPVIELDEKWHDLIEPIDEFNKIICASEMFSTILPIGDGLTVALKI